MKILVITSKSFKRIDGGDTKRIIELAEMFRREFGSDCQIDIVTSNDKQKQNFYQYEIQQGMVVTSFKSYGYFSLLLYFYLLLDRRATLQTLYFWSRRKEIFIRDNKQNYDLIIVHHMRNVLHLKNIEAQRILLELTDSISMTYDQLFDDGRFSLRKLIFWVERFFVNRSERLISIKGQKISLISEVDAEYFVKKLQCSRSRIGVIPNSISCARCSSASVFEKNGKKSLLFIGAFTSLQNQAGLKWFYNKVYLPNDELHDYSLVLIGKGSGKYQQYPNVVTYEFVENFEDIIIQDILCGIAPLLIAGGQQNKIIDYINAGVPFVGTKQSTKWLRVLGVEIDQTTNDNKDFAELILHLKNKRSEVYFDQLNKLKMAQKYNTELKDRYFNTFIRKIIGEDL